MKTHLISRPGWLTLGAAMVVAAVAMAPNVGTAGAVDEFYRGKTMKMIIRSNPGGGYDTYARMLARHIIRHIPGPVRRIIPVNMPGGGGIKAANYIAGVAPRDGTILTIVSQGLPMYQALRLGKKLKADMSKFNWIGNMSYSNQLFVTWHTSPVKTVADARKRSVNVGATGAGSIAVRLPASYNYLLGTKLNVIFGYTSGAHINLALERGEVEGRGTNTWASYRATKADWVMKGKLNYLIQVGFEKEKELQHVPLLMDLVKGDKDKEAVAKFMTLAVMVGRPIAVAQGVPADRVKALRKAYNATIADTQFLTEAKKRRAEIRSMDGPRLQGIIEEIINTPEPLLDLVRIAITPKGAKKRVPQYVTAKGTITKVRRKGSRLNFKLSDGKKVKVRAHGRRTKVTVGGNKAKRKALKVGMTCAIKYEGSGTEAATLKCK